MGSKVSADEEWARELLNAMGFEPGQQLLPSTCTAALKYLKSVEERATELFSIPYNTHKQIRKTAMADQFLERLGRARKAKGRPAKSDVTVNYRGKVNTDVLLSISVSNLRFEAEELGVSVEWLVTGTGEGPT